MSVNGAEHIEYWSLMAFICDLCASLKTEQPQICAQPHVQLSFVFYCCIFYVLNPQACVAPLRLPVVFVYLLFNSSYY